MSAKPPSPQAWLWAAIARRFGSEAATRLHADYLAQSRVYHWHRRYDVPTEPPPPIGRPKKKKVRY